MKIKDDLLQNSLRGAKELEEAGKKKKQKHSNLKKTAEAKKLHKNVKCTCKISVFIFIFII